MSSALLLLALLQAAPAPSGERAYAVVVANNRPFEGALAPLRYADDDGARYLELLDLATADARLLSVLDPPTQEIYPEAARRARSPSLAELDTALTSVFAAIEQDRARGLRTIFYFVYVGHGSIGENGEGVMHLLDGYFSRTELFQRVISRSPATVNHVVIDACNAYFMVAKRGMDTDAVDQAVDDFLDRESLDSYPNTGVLVSTSKAAEVHEWSRFEAGVFSHEVRSGMAGAADVDGDGDITYDELRAFIAAANGRVRDPKARIDAFGKPPALSAKEPIFSRARTGEAPTLRVPGQLAGRYWLQDGRGVRFADFHTSAGTPVTLTLVPSSTYFLRNDQTEMVVPVDVQKEADASELEQRPVEVARRGSEDLAFREALFALPFGRAYYEGYRASLRPRSPALVATAEAPLIDTRRGIAIGMGVASVAAFSGALALGLSANAKAEAFRSAIGDEATMLEQDAQDRALGSNILYGVAGATLVTGLLLWFWPN